MKYRTTPDGRYFVVSKTLERCPNPALDAVRRNKLVLALLAARRAARDTREDPEKLAKARAEVKATRIALGERGPPWWTDGAPDFSRRNVKLTPYARWFEELSARL